MHGGLLRIYPIKDIPSLLPFEKDVCDYLYRESKY
jgi:hypothetical protein